jgi:hypothetical protein
MMLTVPFETGPEPKDVRLFVPGAVLLPDPPPERRFAALDPSGGGAVITGKLVPLGPAKGRLEMELFGTTEVSEPVPSVVKPGVPLMPSVVRPRPAPTVERPLRAPVPIGAAPGEPMPPREPVVPLTWAEAGPMNASDRSGTRAKRTLDTMIAPWTVRVMLP